MDDADEAGFSPVDSSLLLIHYGMFKNTFGEL
jgi:tRNA nucleotidyltransferase (CCA-adding enzyme)